MKVKGRGIIYELGGFYILLMAYNLLKNCMNSVDGEFVLVIIFGILFIMLGLAMMLTGLLMGYRSYKKRNL